MGRTIRTCKFGLGCALLASPLAANAPENLVERYAAARIADIAEQDRIALDGYLKLYKQAPDSEILADRLFDSAIRAGDMATAVRAARALELQNGGSNETALLLFADAWRAKNWRMAGLAADELEAGGSLAFMAPMLKSWVNVAQGRSAGLPEADAEADGFFAYYSADQRIYLDLASGQHTKAKLGLRNIAGQSGDHVRDVMIAGVHVFLEQDRAFAAALMRSAVGSTDVLPEKATEKLPASQGLAALYARISAALTEQQLPAEGLLLARIADWIAPSQANIQLILVGALRGEGLTADALKMLERTQPASAYRLPLLEKRIDLLIASGNAASALDIARHAAAISPKSVATKLLVARAHDAAGNLAAVVSTYREITGDSDFSALVPRQQGAYRLLLAVALDRAGDWASAKTELEKLLAIDPNNAQALNYLGYSLLERGAERERATDMVKRAYALEPTSSAIADSLGWAYYLAGDAARALPLLETAAKEAGSDAAINEHLGDTYWTLGRRRDARYAWRVASQNSEGDAALRLSRKIDAGLIDTAR